MAPRILIFSIVLGAECSFYVKSIATYGPRFLGHNNSFLAIVRALELVTLSLKIPNQAAEWEHYKLWHYNGFKVIMQLHSIYQNCRKFPFVSFTLLINCSLHKQKILSVYKSIFGITKSLVSFTNLFSN